MKLFNYLFLLLISSATVAVNAAETAKTGIEKMDAEWTSSFADDNTHRLMSLYSKEAIMFPPSSEILKGKSEIGEYFKQLKTNGVNQYELSSVDVNIDGDTAYETALWEATRVDTNGNVFKFNGNITNVLERQINGSWKIKYQYWN